MDKKLEIYAQNLAEQAQNLAESNKLEQVAFLKMLAFFSPCNPDTPENKRLSTEELKKLVAPVVTLKVNEITKIMLAAGFEISVNSEMAAAWNIQQHSAPVVSFKTWMQ